MSERIRKIFDILGIEPGEEFQLEEPEVEGVIYRFTYDLSLEFKDGCEVDDIGTIRWYKSERLDRYKRILTGEVKIKKLFEITDEVKIIIETTKALGYSYIARDKDGKIYAYRDIPAKYHSGSWSKHEFGTGEFTRINIDIPFVRWEDAEPYYIGE